MILGLQQQNGERIIYQIYRICFLSTWEKETLNYSKSEWEGFIYNQHSDDKFENLRYYNQHDMISRHGSDPEVDKFN